MKLDHRNYLDLNEKTCLQGFRPCKSQTNLLSFRMLKFCVWQVYHLYFHEREQQILGADQTARMCRLVYAVDVRMQLRQVFSRHVHKYEPSDYEINQADVSVIIIIQCFHTLAGSVY